MAMDKSGSKSGGSAAAGGTKAAEKENGNECSADQKSGGLEIRKVAVDKIIRNHAYGSAGVGLIPIPIVDLVSLTALQLNMVRCLAKLYGLEFKKDIVKGLVASLIGGVVPTAVAGPAASLIKAIPIVGPVVGALTMSGFGSAATYAVGRVFVMHFEAGGNFLNFNPEQVRSYFFEEFEKHGGKTSSAG